MNYKSIQEYLHPMSAALSLLAIFRAISHGGVSWGRGEGWVFFLFCFFFDCFCLFLFIVVFFLLFCFGVLLLVFFFFFFLGGGGALDLITKPYKKTHILSWLDSELTEP